VTARGTRAASGMPRKQRYANVAAVIVPFLGLIVALVLLWNRFVGWIDVGILVGGYLAAGLGVTVGYHRLITRALPGMACAGGSSTSPPG
jgi:fatty-acid desaturase